MTNPKPPLAKRIFVFDTDILGEHKTDAAIRARRFHGAARGVGFGLAGNSFAIPCFSTDQTPLPIFQISLWIAKFLTYAKEHKELQFDVEEIGCDGTSYEAEDIAPYFTTTTSNIRLPVSFKNAISARMRTGEADTASLPTTTLVTDPDQ